jgi:hypothetical protein
MNSSNEANPPGTDKVQGEGDYEAARRYDKAAREFAESGKVDEAARDAKPTSPQEADELRRAESEGKSHAKGEDPLLNRPSNVPSGQ